MIWFWWLWPIFQGIQRHLTPWKNTCLHSIFWIKSQILTKLAHIHYLGGHYEMTRFWWTWPDIQGHQIPVLLYEKAFSALNLLTGPCSTVGNISGYRCEADCRSRGREFDPGPVPYFRGDWSWNNFYGHSPPFRWIIHEGLLSVTSESMCTITG